MLCPTHKIPDRLTSLFFAVMLLSFPSPAVTTTRVPTLMSSTLIAGFAFTFVSLFTLNLTSLPSLSLSIT